MRRFIFDLALFHFWAAKWLDSEYASMVLVYEGKEYTCEDWYGSNAAPVACGDWETGSRFA